MLHLEVENGLLGKGEDSAPASGAKKRAWSGYCWSGRVLVVALLEDEVDATWLLEDAGLREAVRCIPHST
jgi:hypothetical protein